MSSFRIVQFVHVALIRQPQWTEHSVRSTIRLQRRQACRSGPADNGTLALLKGFGQSAGFVQP